MILRRKQLKLTQAQVARILNVEQSTISAWESGRRAPTSLEVFDALSHALECAPAWLLYGVEETPLMRDIQRLDNADQYAIYQLVHRLLKGAQRANPR